MKSLKEFLRKFDSFGVSYSFKYKSKDKYTTSFGGIITILFVVVALIIGIYSFIPFYNKKNFSTIYYVLKLADTEQIYFKKSKVAFSIGLNCNNGSDGTKADDLFDVYHKYIYWEYHNNDWNSTTELMGTHQCTHEDFFNDYNKSFDESSVYNYQCLDDFSKPMQGIYTSSVFSYYEFDVYAKNNSKELLDKIDNYLIEKDCKLQIYYIDKTIDVDDYKDPVKGYLQAFFIQINPTLSTRRNIYFMNQHLYDDDAYIWQINAQNNEEESKISSLYSRYEEYSLYQGLNRTNSSSDYLNYVKIFFRADTRKTYVKRRYQNFMEFYADASSLLMACYEILIIIFNYINTFYAELSLSKKIFFFKELNDNHLDIYKHSKKIEDLFSLSKNDSQNIRLETNINDKEGLITPPSKLKNIIDNSNNNSNQINTIKRTNRKISRISLPRKTLVNLDSNLITNKLDVKSDNDTINKLKINNNQSQDMYVQKKKITNIFNLKRTKSFYYVNNINEKTLIKKYIKYNFNIFEIIFASFCKCCLPKNLKVKNNLNVKANNILNITLDVAYYIRNQLLFDIINKTILDEKIKSIVNFLCRPIISIDKENKNEFSDFYRSYKEDDFQYFSNELTNLVNKSKTNIKEKKLISLANSHLQDLIINNF